MAIEPLEKQLASFRDQKLSARKLRDISFEALSSWFKDTDHPGNMLLEPIVKEIFLVAEWEEKFKTGDTSISRRSIRY